MRGAYLLGWQVSARNRLRGPFYGVPDPWWSSCRVIYQHAPIGRLKWLSRPLPLMARRQLVEELIWKKVKNILKNSVWVQLIFGRSVGPTARILAKFKSLIFGTICHSPKIAGTMQTLQRWCNISPWTSYLGIAELTTEICWIVQLVGTIYMLIFAGMFTFYSILLVWTINTLIPLI